VIVYLRNTHAKQVVYLPIRPGWCRVLKPAVTTAVPAALLHTAAVRQLLIRNVVDGAAWDADVSQRRASRTDMARAIVRPAAGRYGRPAALLVRADRTLAGAYRGRGDDEGTCGRVWFDPAGDWPSSARSRSAGRIELVKQTTRDKLLNEWFANSLTASPDVVGGQHIPPLLTLVSRITILPTPK
jgi:hypothetical protein